MSIIKHIYTSTFQSRTQDKRTQFIKHFLIAAMTIVPFSIHEQNLHLSISRKVFARSSAMYNYHRPPVQYPASLPETSNLASIVITIPLLMYMFVCLQAMAHHQRLC